MPPAELKTYAEIVEIGFKIAALLVGGAWAIYAFIVFRQRQSAITALRKAESEAASLELAARRRAVLDISIQHDVHKDLSGNGFILTIHVVISNAGVAPAVMNFEGEEPTLRVHRVNFDEHGKMSFPHEPTSLKIRSAADPNKEAKGRHIRAGGTSRLSAVVRLQDAGVYAISFRVPMDDLNRQALIEARGETEKRPYWSANAFASVGLEAASVLPDGSQRS